MSDHQVRLSRETSPYLLQHATNPVDWYPWGQEALQKAKEENKPIFLSIGYSSCHWCHVMAHECFENPEIAKLMNQWFVNIKVDREEYPDVDAIYMKALVELTGQGGWPLSIFLTPDQKPYLGGTYFPPTPKFNRPGFPQVLEQAYKLFSDDPIQTDIKSQNLLEKIHLQNKAGKPLGVKPNKLIKEAIDIFKKRFDEEYGGFGSGMKFPEPMHYTLMLRYWAETGDEETLHILDKSLTKMAEGGLFDQLGGGFHRYSTDRFWRVPHFEKMLYDNGLLAKLFLDMFQATKQDIYREIPEQIFFWMESEMTSQEGAFFSSQDADTEGHEGAWYTWELKEVLNLLGPKHAKVFSKAFGMTSKGQLDGRNVLYLNMKVEALAEMENIPIFEADHILKKGKKTLFEARRKRTCPDTDKKIITSWNGLMITALATGYSVLGEEKYIKTAKRCAEFIWSEQWKDGKLYRIYKDGQSSIAGCLEDYAYFFEALITLYETSLQSEWLSKARQLADAMIKEFWDKDEGGFFLSGKLREQLVAKLKNPADEAMPSANAIASMALLKLGRLTGNKTYIEKSEETIKAFQIFMEQSPVAFTGLLSTLSASNLSPTEVIFAGPKEDAMFDEMWKVLHTDYRPNKVVVWNENGESNLPLAEGKNSIELTVYICQKGTCHPPVSTAKALDRLLERPQEIRLNIYDENKKNAQILEQEQNNFMGVMGKIFQQSGITRPSNEE
ncbi:MAG: thioredoxin domain-containing protein [Nitrospinales bacterium]|nr:thioredoxin domain-containing protein [Nitrospinales bacterium]